MCSLLLVLVALITYGDAALNDYFEHLRGETAEAHAVHTFVMLSTLAMAAASAKTMWLGDTGAGMHRITDASLAVKGSLRTNSTLIIRPMAPQHPSIAAM
eukprot:4506101-Pleurochrysis_carterae.AAC.1